LTFKNEREIYMKKGSTEIFFILDRSGSMDNLKEDVIGGYNFFVRKQKEVKGEVNMNLAFFNNVYDIPFPRCEINKVPKLDTQNYCPRGSTALLDAIGRTITDMDATFSKLSEEEKPEKVVIAILTDGQENSSVEYKKSQIVEKIAEKEKLGWEFLYLASSLAGINDALSYGISGTNAIQFDNSSYGLSTVYATSANLVNTYRKSDACVTWGKVEEITAMNKTADPTDKLKTKKNEKIINKDLTN